MFGPLRRRPRRSARYRLPQVECLETRQLLATFVVTNTDSDGPGSLRAAIASANVEPEADRIEFNLSGAGPHVIRPTTAYAEIEFPVEIDGTSQPGYDGVPLIELDGVNLVQADARGLTLLGGSTIRGLAINRFNRSGVTLFGSDNVVEGNFIGIDRDGTRPRGNGIGVELLSAERSRIGGLDPQAGNVISGNDSVGIWVGRFRDAAPSRDNEIHGNFIGTDVAGQIAIGNGRLDNQSAGIVLNDARDNTIGGPDAQMGNIISGNFGAGVLITAGSSGNRLRGNRIGTDVTGMQHLGNVQGGVVLVDSTRNQIGDGTAQGRNLISGNAVAGVSVSSATPGENQIQGNWIGTDQNGDRAIPNSVGIIIDDSSFNQIGGATNGTGSEVGNLVSGNLGSGILIVGANAIGNSVRGNTIGSDLPGQSAIPNGDDGIRIDNSGFSGGDANSMGNEIGGDSDDLANRIFFNSGAGIAIIDRDTNPTSWSINRIRFNSLAHNSKLGIDLRPGGVEDGITPNDAGDEDTGPNGLQNFPVLELVEAGESTRIAGLLDSPNDRNYLIDFYLGEVSPLERAAEGRQYLGSVLMTPDDHPRFEAVVGQTSADDYITATAIDLRTGDTSEFSPLGRVAGKIVEDLTNNGVSDDDQPIAGWMVELILDDGDGIFDPATDRAVASRQTDSTGQYAFDHVRPGTYFVVQESREGYGQSAGGDDPEEASPLYTRTIVSASEFAELDFANFRLSRIAGRKLSDTRRDGITPDDRPLPGWTIELFRETEGELVLIDSATTDEEGRYQFIALSPGIYVVEEVAQTNFTPTEPPSGSHRVEIQSGDEANHDALDFANYEDPILSGRKVEDLTGDGTSADDRPLSDWSIQLFRDDGDGVFSPELDELVQTKTTDAEGRFELENVTPTLHFVVEGETIGFRQTDGGDSFPDVPFYAIDVMSGVKRTDLNFANGRISRLTGKKVRDLTGDGNTVDDIPLAAWEIQVYRDNGDGDFHAADDALIGSTRTDDQGEYLFDVTPGIHFVVDGFTKDDRQTDGGDQFSARPYYTIEAAGGREFSDLDFANAPHYPSGLLVRFAATADYDGDGDADVALVNELSDLANRDGGVTLYFGDGMGDFADPRAIAVGRRPHAVVTADLDGDPHPDLVVTHVGDGTVDSNRVLLLLNGGDAAFVRREIVVAGDGPIDVVADDLNGDGLSDLAVSNFRSNDVSILLGDGAGSFRLHQTVGVGRQPISVAGFDPDGDGDQDLVVANYQGDSLSLLRNNGNGGFTLVREIPTAAGPSDLYVAQLDDDNSRMDVAVTGFTQDQVAIHYDLDFVADESPVLLRLGTLANQARPQSIVAFDFTGDDRNDLAIAESESSVITVLQNEGRRRFSLFGSFPNAGGPEFVTSTELTDDPSADLLSTSLNRTQINQSQDVSFGGLNVTLNRNVDLSISVDNDTNRVIPGRPFTYTIVVGNHGPNPVQGASVLSFLDEVLTDVSFESFATGDASGHTEAGSGNVDDHVSLGVGARITYIVTATAAPSARGAIESSVEVSPPSELNEIDRSNNFGSDADLLLPLVDIAIDVDDGGGSPVAGRDDLTYVVTASNLGPSTANNLEISSDVMLITDTSLVSVTPSRGVYDEMDQRWTIESLPAGAEATLTFVVAIESSTPDGSVVIQASALRQVSERESDPTNNSAVKMTVIRGADDTPADPIEQDQRGDVLGQPLVTSLFEARHDVISVERLSATDWTEVSKAPGESRTSDELERWIELLSPHWDRLMNVMSD